MTEKKLTEDDLRDAARVLVSIAFETQAVATLELAGAMYLGATEAASDPKARASSATIMAAIGYSVAMLEAYAVGLCPEGFTVDENVTITRAAIDESIARGRRTYTPDKIRTLLEVVAIAESKSRGDVH
jgi:uncharacterized low-complexity protein